jgi:hypothetical protein
MADLADRLAWHGRLAWRASRVGIVLGLVGAFLLRLVLPVRGGWLAAMVASVTGVLALACIAMGRGPLPTLQDVGASLEKVGAADQVAHGLLRAALVLGAFALGLWTCGLAVALLA